MSTNWLLPQGVIIESPVHGPHGCYFQGVGRYSDPAQLGICVKCQQHIGAPIHGEWRERVRRLAAEWAVQESSWNVSKGEPSPSQGLFQTYIIGESNGQPPVVIGPVHDDLLEMKPLRWSSEWGEGEFQNSG